MPVTSHICSLITNSFLPDQTKSLIDGDRTCYYYVLQSHTSQLANACNFLDTLHAAHCRRRSCILKVVSHHNRHYELLRRQEKDLAIYALLFQRRFVFIYEFSSQPFPSTFLFHYVLEDAVIKSFVLVSKSKDFPITSHEGPEGE